MSRLPIRVRLTIAFALAMAIVLTGLGGLLYVRLGNALIDQLDRRLEARTNALASVVRARASDPAGGELSSGDKKEFAQLVDADGSLVAASPTVSAAPLVSAREIDRATRGAFFFERTVRDADDADIEGARLLVTPLASERRQQVLVVGELLESSNDALEELLTQLLVVGPLALLLSSVLGYVMAAAALGPVEAMRRRAAEISTESPGRRLPLPAARDEIRRLGETVNAMLERLEAGLERERRFVADASHELRTPLALLATELELALRRPRSREELEASIRSAADEVDRLTRLAEDLLVLARSDEGGLPLREETIETSALLDDVARRFAPRADAAARRVEVDAANGGPVVGDRLRLEQALGNLVDNALRHGGGTISLEAQRRDGRVELVVSDEGAGFPAGFLPRAFDRFARADSARGSGAAGLGLAIVDVIARAHGGSAVAANGTARGAVVMLTLPVR